MADKGFKKLNFAIPLSMETAVPLDYNSFFRSYADAQRAAAMATSAGLDDSIYYIGQLVTVVDDANRTVRQYRINHDHTLSLVGNSYTFTDGLCSRGANGDYTVGIQQSIRDDLASVYGTTETLSGRWNTAFSTVNTMSADWQETADQFKTVSGSISGIYSTVEEGSANWNWATETVSSSADVWNGTADALNASSASWNNAAREVSINALKWSLGYTEIAATSANNRSVFTTVKTASGGWGSMRGDIDKILGVIPYETWNDNMLADKKYVESRLNDYTSNFRGSFETWTKVPTSADGYKEDAQGHTTPLKNDYIVIQDASELEQLMTVSNRLVGRTAAVDVVDSVGEIVFYANHVFVEADISELVAHAIETVTCKLDGTWRFKFNGVWEEGEEGKRKWTPEFQINVSPFSQEQIDALNSGINRQLVTDLIPMEAEFPQVRQLSGNWQDAYSEIFATSADNRSVFTSVNEASASWNAVSGKVDSEWFKFYTESAWSELTHDDTDYSRVPDGLNFIYEGDEPVVTDGHYIDHDTGILTLSRSTSIDANGILTIGTAVLSADVLVLNTSDSPQTDAPSKFDLDTGILKISQKAVFDTETGILTFSQNDTLDLTSGVFTIYGKTEGGEPPPVPPPTEYHSISYQLTHVTIDNDIERIGDGGTYEAHVIPEIGYALKTVTAAMGGNTHHYPDGHILIQNVSDSIVINAEAEYVIPPPVGEDEDVIDSETGILTLGNSAFMSNGILTLNERTVLEGDIIVLNKFNPAPLPVPTDEIDRLTGILTFGTSVTADADGIVTMNEFSALSGDVLVLNQNYNP